jgi:glycosyltransferase involved in cell wall biosynthesis
VDSVLVQGRKDLELIVVDDGSTDNTHVVLSDYIRNAQIRYHKQANQGVGVARNFGYSLSKGQYLIFLDSDDSLCENYFNEINAIIVSQPDIVFVGVSIFQNSLLTKQVLPSMPYGKPSDNGLFLAGAFIIKKELFSEVGGYDPMIKYGENTELAIRINKQTHSSKFVDKCLLKVNQAGTRESSSPQNIIESISYTLKKHDIYYNTDLANKRLYLQILGISYLRLKQSHAGRRYLWRAYCLAPFNMINLLRLTVSFVPIICDKVYVHRR